MFQYICAVILTRTQFESDLATGYQFMSAS